MIDMRGGEYTVALPNACKLERIVLRILGPERVVIFT